MFENVIPVFLVEILQMDMRRVSERLSEGVTKLID